LSDPYKTH